MANICTNQLIISNDAYSQIAHLFLQPQNDYENPYLDFEKIKPIPPGSNAQFEWGVSCRPYNTHILKCESDSGKTIIEFQTHWSAPHGVIESLIRQYKFDAELYSFEPGNEYGCIALYEFDDAFIRTIEDADYVNDLLNISLDSDDIDEPCLKIHGLTFEEYICC